MTGDRGQELVSLVALWQRMDGQRAEVLRPAPARRRRTRPEAIRRSARLRQVS